MPWRLQQSGLFSVFYYMSPRKRVATVLAALLVIIWLTALVVHGPAHSHSRSAATAAHSR